MANNGNTLNLKKPLPAPSPNDSQQNGLDDRGESSETASPSASSTNNGNTLATSTDVKKEPRISFGTSLLMIITAIFFDSSQLVFGAMGLIPIVGVIIGASFSFMLGFFAWMTFYMWFKMHGVSFMRPQRLIALLGAGFVELVPFLNALPTWTFAVIFLIANTRIEDKTGKSVLKLANPIQGGNVPKAN